MPATCVVAALRPELLRSLKRTLEPEFEVVAMIDNVLSLHDSMKALAPELVLVDLELLGASPWKLVEKLRRNCPDASVIVLGEVLEQEAREQARAVGVDAVVPSSRAASELVSVAQKTMGR